MQKKYCFTSERLGFRNWTDDDIPLMSAINQDPEVMEFFPALVAPELTAAFIVRMQALFSEKGYCYFAVDELASGCFIGFIGLCDQSFEAPFTPCTDIGWRLSKQYWNKGYATEGAKRCLDYAFAGAGLKEVVATAPKINLRSIHVMEKIGMKKLLEFRHPRLEQDPRLVNCACYTISAR